MGSEMCIRDRAATGAENAIVDGGSRQLPEGFRVTYLVSSAQGEDALKALFALYAGRTDIRFAFRGIPPGMTVPDFGVWLLSLFENQSLLETTEIVIDPEIFTHTAATLAPTLVLEDVTRPQTDLAPGQPAISDPSETSASVLATAIGTGTPQWLYDRYRSGQTSYSSVNAVPITEEDLRIRAEREATAQLAKLTTDPEVLANRYWDRLARDLDRAPVTPALIARDRPLRAFYEVTSPIRDAEGRILAYPGEVFDPSTVLPFDRQILVFDPTRPAELGFVAERLAAPPPGVVRQMLIASRLPAVTAGQAPWQGLQDLVDRFRLPVYVLTADFRRGFGVEHTPTEIRPVGSSVILTETAVGGGTDAP